MFVRERRTIDHNVRAQTRGLDVEPEIEGFAIGICHTPFGWVPPDFTLRATSAKGRNMTLPDAGMGATFNRGGLG